VPFLDLLPFVKELTPNSLWGIANRRASDRIATDRFAVAIETALLQSFPHLLRH
jgi:hypothetical protein